MAHLLSKRLVRLILTILVSVALIGCGNIFGPDSSADDDDNGVSEENGNGENGVQPDFNAFAQELADYDESTGSLLEEGEAAFMFSISPMMFTGMAGEQTGVWDDAFEGFGKSIEEWVDGDHGDEEWWEQDKHYDKDGIYFDYKEKDGDIDALFVFQGTLDISENPIGPEDDLEFTSGTIDVTLDIEFSGVIESAEEGQGYGSADVFLTIEIDGMSDESEDNIMHHGLTEVEMQLGVEMSLEDDAIGVAVEASFASGVSVNIADGPEGLSDFNGKYVVLAELQEEGYTKDNEKIEDFLERFIMELLETPLVVDVCLNSGEIIDQYDFTLGDLEDLGP